MHFIFLRISRWTTGGATSITVVGNDGYKVNAIGFENALSQAQGYKNAAEKRGDIVAAADWSNIIKN